MSRELRIHSVPTRAEQIRTIVEIVAIVAAGIWALYTFVYEQRIKPLSEAPSFMLPTLVDQGPTVDGVVFLTIHKRVENTGNVPIDVAAEAISVFGEVLVHGQHSATKTHTATLDELIADVRRKPVTVLFSHARLRSGAIGGDTTSFFLTAHSSNEASYLVAVPVKRYPVVLIARKDFIVKAPIAQKLLVKIVRTSTGAYGLQSSVDEGEYDSDLEYAIKP